MRSNQTVQAVGTLAIAVIAGTGGWLLGRASAGSGDATPASLEAPAEGAGSGDEGEDAAGFVEPVDLLDPPRTLLDTASADVDGDGAAERIELHAEVERDARGRLAWDDGQRWLLVVRDGEVAYPLFDGLVQLGRLGFAVVERGEETPVILATVEAGAAISTEAFGWDDVRGGFASLGRVEATGNVTHRTPEGVGS